jgi:hypothetical protein
MAFKSHVAKGQLRLSLKFTKTWIPGEQSPQMTEKDGHLHVALFLGRLAEFDDLIQVLTKTPSFLAMSISLADNYFTFT